MRRASPWKPYFKNWTSLSLNQPGDNPWLEAVESSEICQTFGSTFMCWLLCACVCFHSQSKPEWKIQGELHFYVTSTRNIFLVECELPPCLVGFWFTDIEWILYGVIGVPYRCRGYLFHFSITILDTKVYLFFFSFFHWWVLHRPIKYVSFWIYHTITDYPTLPNAVSSKKWLFNKKNTTHKKKKTKAKERER